MKTIEYNVTLMHDGKGNWYANCPEPLLPGVHAPDRQAAVWNVYKVIFEDLAQANNSQPFSDSLELRVNIIER